METLMNSRKQRRRTLRSATIAVAIFASFSQILLVDAVAKSASEQMV